MATLSINGRKVRVDDSFRQMTPEQQSAAVEEIAAKLNISAQPGNAPSDAAFDEALASASQKSQFGGGPVTPRAQPGQPRPTLGGSALATVQGIYDVIPGMNIVQQGTDWLAANTLGRLSGQDPQAYQEGIEARRQQTLDANPIAQAGGAIGGSLLGMGAAGLTNTGARVLGMSGNLGQRVVNSAASNAGITLADALLDGESGADATAGGMLSGAIGGAIPLVGAGIGAAARSVGKQVVRPIATAFNRDNEAILRVGQARRQAANINDVLTPADEAMAARAGTPVLNADRGGEPLRTLARTASNISTEAAGNLKRAAQERFEGQAGRATRFLREVMGGATDDLGLQQRLSASARASNRPAYDAAYSAPNARAIWSPQIRQLMQSDIFRGAINAAESAGTDQAALTGGRAVRNPFVFGQDGTITLRQMPDGTRALPSLEFWDIVQRNLRRTETTARRQGDDTLAGTTAQLRRMLNNELDGAVPEFQRARQGAYEFFQAEDALEAGRNAVNLTRQVPEMRQAYARMSAADRQAAAVGYASSLIDMIGAARDRVNVIQQVFGSPARRELNELFLGPARAREVEAFVHMENALDQLRTAVSGNSSTAQQLIAAGVLGGAGGLWASGGNVNTALTSAALLAAGRRGLQMLGKRVDDMVMQRIAEILVSDDPALINQAVRNATLSAQHMDALRAFGVGIENMSKAGAIGLAAAE